MSLGTAAPVYVTRKTADGEIAYYSLSLWMSLLAMMLVWANVIVWGALGLYFAARVIL